MDSFRNNFGLQMDPNFQSPGGGMAQGPDTPPPGMQQPQLSPELIAAVLAMQGPAGAAERAQAKAAALRGQRRPTNALGLGPLGVRTGEGPGGWAISLGDMVGGLVGRAEDKAADEKAAQDQAAADMARQIAYRKYLDSLQGSAGPVSQGAPLTSASPLGL